jgi:hypothetical protein
MQTMFRQKWNAAISLLAKMRAESVAENHDRSNYNIPLDRNGNCAGFAAAFLEYQSREDLLAFYNYINYINRQSPEAIAKLLASKNPKESKFANELLRFVAMVATLQDKQKKESLNHTGSLRTANVHRINSKAQSVATVEVLSNESSAVELISKLNINEGMILGAEAHAYAIYRSGENEWMIFDSNDSASAAAQTFTSTNKAARKLLSVVDKNVEYLASSKMSETRQVFHDIFKIFVRFINLFKRGKQLLSPISLAAAHMMIPKKIGGTENQASEKSQNSSITEQKGSHSKILQRIVGRSNAEVLAMRAIEIGDCELLKNVVKKFKLDVNKPWPLLHGDNGNTEKPLFFAINSNNPEAIQTLLDIGCNINDTHKLHLCPLSLAVIQENTALVKKLLENSADPNFMDTKGYSPLVYAVISKNEEIVKLLLKHNAEPLKVTPKGITPLDIAIHSKQSNLVNLLTSNSPIIDALADDNEAKNLTLHDQGPSLAVF